MISLVLAFVGFFFTHQFPLDAYTPAVVAGSLLISGIVTPWIASLMSNGNTATSSTDIEIELDDNVSTLYVGNLPYKANEDAVKAYFENHIRVQSVRLMKDKKTGKRKGYGFIEVVDGDIDAIIGQFNDSVFQDRTLKVRPAKDKIPG
ncbi:RNA recognition motif domain-containing protein [Aestuariibacter sp. GS-14]|uniref:RNA recognition motif domain-containing protein n=1 Tax=Aestuariibacter sp. GS-14 TaxID=2590670 RepID=UPI0035131079